jgi:hypothetical protein
MGLATKPPGEEERRSDLLWTGYIAGAIQAAARPRASSFVIRAELNLETRSGFRPFISLPLDYRPAQAATRYISGCRGRNIFLCTTNFCTLNHSPDIPFTNEPQQSSFRR